MCHNSWIILVILLPSLILFSIASHLLLLSFFSLNESNFLNSQFVKAFKNDNNCLCKFWQQWWAQAQNTMVINGKNPYSLTSFQETSYCYNFLLHLQWHTINFYQKWQTNSSNILDMINVYVDLIGLPR
jgi:hypothetical protein